ncbi:MAG: hypothetical protein ACFB00_09895 [Parvularculaceae bacterium]
MIARIILGALATAAMAGAAFAQALAPPVSNSDGRLADVNIATIEPVMREAFESVERTNVFGQAALRVQEGGAVVVLTPSGCVSDPAPRCRGLAHYSFFRNAPETAALNEFNRSSPVASGTIEEGGSARLSRYAFCDYGCSRGSLVVGVINFIVAGQRFFDLSEQPGTNLVATGLLSDLPELHDVDAASRAARAATSRATAAPSSSKIANDWTSSEAPVVEASAASRDGLYFEGLRY